MIKENSPGTKLGKLAMKLRVATKHGKPSGINSSKKGSIFGSRKRK